MHECKAFVELFTSHKIRLQLLLHTIYANTVWFLTVIYLSLTVICHMPPPSNQNMVKSSRVCCHSNAFHSFRLVCYSWCLPKAGLSQSKQSRKKCKLTTAGCCFHRCFLKPKQASTRMKCLVHVDAFTWMGAFRLKHCIEKVIYLQFSLAL